MRIEGRCDENEERMMRITGILVSAKGVMVRKQGLVAIKGGSVRITGVL